jgi:hypothetical protein
LGILIPFLNVALGVSQVRFSNSRLPQKPMKGESGFLPSLTQMSLSCPVSKVSIKKRPVILSEAYFSGVEGPAFVKLTISQSTLNQYYGLQGRHTHVPAALTSIKKMQYA